jgi:hypothetical protein
VAISPVTFFGDLVLAFL